MINDGINDVPRNKIAVMLTPKSNPLSYEDLETVISRPSKKRDWFTPHFYKCLPLTIANQYGFVITTQTDVELTWNGDDHPSGVSITVEDKTAHPFFGSLFGHGIVTVFVPFHLKTPPGVNLMTLNPPNYIIPNVTALTGVVETDNLRQEFTFNLKLQIPNVTVRIPKGFPVGAVIPIPRYYADGFELVNGSELFSPEVFAEETQAKKDHKDLRISQNEKVFADGMGYETKALYMRGVDVYGNKFSDHQKP